MTEPFIDTELPCSQLIRRCLRANGSRAGVKNRLVRHRDLATGNPRVDAPQPAIGLGFLQKGNEGLYRQARLPDDSPQSTTVEFLVVGHDQLCEGFVSSEDDVAALLPPDEEAGLLERSDALAAGDARQLAHMATSRASKRSGGTARWSSSSAAM